MRRLLLIVLLVASSGALAQTAAYDPDQMPAFHGKVEAFELTPQDELEGFFLDDGVEVHVATHLSSELAHILSKGAAVTIHGLRSQDGQMVQAFSVRDDTSGAEIRDEVASAVPPRGGYQQQGMRFLEATGRIKRLLHTTGGEFAGFVLDDGTNVRVARGLVPQSLHCLVPGREIAVSGTGTAGALGKVIETRSISLVAAVPGNPAATQRCPLMPPGSAAQTAGCSC